MDNEMPSAADPKFERKGAELFVLDDGKKYRIPYHLIKRATFSNLDKDELVDAPHSTMLQYKLLTLEAIIKATVDFGERKITVIYNPACADNGSAKIDMAQLVGFLAKEGVHAVQDSTKDEDYDYYTQFYSYAYAPPSVRKSAPYGYTLEEWKRMEAAFVKSTAKKDKEKLAKFRAWQKEYLKSLLSV